MKNLLSFDEFVNENYDSEGFKPSQEPDVLGKKVETIEDVKNVPTAEKYGVVVQTTFESDKFEKILEAIQNNHKGQYKVERTICNATAKRQASAVDLAKLAGLKPVGVIVEILNDDGTMARVPDLVKFAEKYNLKLITIEALIRYRREKELKVSIHSEARMPTKYGSFRLIGFENNFDNKEHLALVKGDVSGKENVKLRIHSECFTGDILGSLRCDCGDQLQESMKRIDEIGEGVILYMRQEGRGIGLYNKLKAYNLQDEGYDTVEANLKLGFAEDERDYRVAAKMIQELGIKSVSLITNNPLKIKELRELGIEISNREKIIVKYQNENKHYMNTKISKMGHMIEEI